MRWLVSWLPWLSLLSYFKDKDELEGRKRRKWTGFIGFSGIHQERIEFSQPPRRRGDWERRLGEGGGYGSVVRLEDMV